MAYQTIEVRKLVILAQTRMVGDVIGDADEFVKRQNWAAVRQRNQPRGHREILIPRALTGSQLCGFQTH